MTTSSVVSKTGQFICYNTGQITCYWQRQRRLAAGRHGGMV